MAHKVAGAAVLGVTLSSADASVRGSGSGGVMLTTLRGFCPEAAHARDFSHTSVVHYAECFSPEDTVALAVLSAQTAAPYRLLEANCEHFASWCKVGEAVSLQVLAIRGALSRFGVLAAGVLAGTATLARLEFAERTTTRVEHHRGGGVRGALGLSRRRVVVQETTVAQREVLAGAALIGAAAAVAAGAAARLRGALAARRSYRVACHVEGGGGGAREAPPSPARALAAVPEAEDAAAEGDVAGGGACCDAHGGGSGGVSGASAAAAAASLSASAAASASASAVRVVILSRRSVQRGGLAALRAHVAGAAPDGTHAASAAAAGSLRGTLRVWRADSAAWEPLDDVATLPRCASLRLSHA